MKAWYFSTADKKLRYGDNRPISVGVTHTVEGKPSCCNHGLHGSEMILDALKYGPGMIAWIVELDGDMDKQYDKIAATSRTYLHGGIDVTRIILAWSRRVALDVAHLWDMPDVVRRFLETGENCAAAANAAASAAYTAYAAAYTAANAAANAAIANANAANANAADYASAAADAAADAANANARGKYSSWLAEDVSKAIMDAEK